MKLKKNNKMEKIKTAEEILYEIILKKFPNTTKDEFEETITNGSTAPIALKAMKAYHSQFNISDEEINEEAGKRYKSLWRPPFAKGAKWMRDKILKTEK